VDYNRGRGINLFTDLTQLKNLLSEYLTSGVEEEIPFPFDLKGSLSENNKMY
jgi:hypothetical protein